MSDAIDMNSYADTIGAEVAYTNNNSSTSSQHMKSDDMADDKQLESIIMILILEGNDETYIEKEAAWYIDPNKKSDPKVREKARKMIKNAHSILDTAFETAKQADEADKRADLINMFQELGIPNEITIADKIIEKQTINSDSLRKGKIRAEIEGARSKGIADMLERFRLREESIKNFDEISKQIEVIRQWKEEDKLNAIYAKAVYYGLSLNGVANTGIMAENRKVLESLINEIDSLILDKNINNNEKKKEAAKKNAISIYRKAFRSTNRAITEFRKNGNQGIEEFLNNNSSMINDWTTAMKILDKNITPDYVKNLIKSSVRSRIPKIGDLIGDRKEAEEFPESKAAKMSLRPGYASVYYRPMSGEISEPEFATWDELKQDQWDRLQKQKNGLPELRPISLLKTYGIEAEINNIKAHVINLTIIGVNKNDIKKTTDEEIDKIIEKIVSERSYYHILTSPEEYKKQLNKSFSKIKIFIVENFYNIPSDFRSKLKKAFLEEDFDERSKILTEFAPRIIYWSELLGAEPKEFVDWVEDTIKKDPKIKEINKMKKQIYELAVESLRKGLTEKETIDRAMFFFPEIPQETITNIVNTTRKEQCSPIHVSDTAKIYDSSGRIKKPPELGKHIDTFDRAKPIEKSKIDIVQEAIMPPDYGPMKEFEDDFKYYKTRLPEELRVAYFQYLKRKRSAEDVKNLILRYILDKTITKQFARYIIREYLQINADEEFAEIILDEYNKEEITYESAIKQINELALPVDRKQFYIDIIERIATTREDIERQDRRYGDLRSGRGSPPIVPPDTVHDLSRPGERISMPQPGDRIPPGTFEGRDRRGREGGRGGSGGGGSGGGGMPSEVRMHSSFSLHVTTSPKDAGDISARDAFIPGGEEVVVHQVPAAGYEFSHWAVNGIDYKPGKNNEAEGILETSEDGKSLRLRMIKDFFVIAVYKADELEVDIGESDHEAYLITKVNKDGSTDTARSEFPEIDIWSIIKKGDIDRIERLVWTITNERGEKASVDEIEITSGDISEEKCKKFRCKFKEPGSYIVSLKAFDAKGHIGVSSKTKTIKSPFSISINTDKNNEEEVFNVKMWATINGGYPPYKFKWIFDDQKEHEDKDHPDYKENTDIFAALSEDKAIQHSYVVRAEEENDEYSDYTIILEVTDGEMRKVIDKKKIRVRKGKKEDKMTAGTNWKGDSPRRPQFLGALERGAFKKADDLETTSGVKYTRGMETMLPRLRMAINAGRRELGKEARRYATEYVREMQIKLKGNLRRLKKARDNYENLLKSSNDSVKKALDLKRISTATALTKKGMGLDKLVGMFANLEQEISNNQKSGAITGVLAEQLREAFQEYKDARNEAGAIEQTVDGWIVKRAKIREEMERHLLGYADKMISRLMYRYHLFEGFEGSRGEIAGPSQQITTAFKDAITNALKGEASWLAEWWTKWNINKFTTFVRNAYAGLRTMSLYSMSVGDVWMALVDNIRTFFTGPWVWGSILIFVLWMFSASYLPPDMPWLFSQPIIIPAISAILLTFLNFANVRYFMDFFTHLVSGAIIGYSLLLFVSSLGIYYLWGGGLEMQIFLIVVVIVLWLIGAFQFYAAGGFNVIFVLAVIIMIFAYFSLGPYSGYVREIRDQVLTPIKQIWYALKDAVTDVWYLMTNPTEYYARQQMKSVKPEKPLSWPKALEVTRLDLVPDTVPEGGEFTMYAVVKNDGEMPAKIVKVLAECEADRWLADKEGLQAADGSHMKVGGGCMAVVNEESKSGKTVSARPIDAWQSSLRIGGGDMYTFRFKAGFLPTDRIPRVVFNKLNFSIQYTYSTNSSLTTEIATYDEITRRQTEKEQYYTQQVAVARIGPAMIGMTVGYQPLQTGKKAILTVTVMNKRPDGTVVLKNGKTMRIKLPETIGSDLVCSGPGIAALCPGKQECEMTFTGRNGLDWTISNYEYKEILPILCTFNVVSTVPTGSRTGVITAELPEYDFILKQQKEITVTPNPRPAAAFSDMCVLTPYEKASQALRNLIPGASDQQKYLATQQVFQTNYNEYTSKYKDMITKAVTKKDFKFSSTQAANGKSLADIMGSEMLASSLVASIAWPLPADQQIGNSPTGTISSLVKEEYRKAFLNAEFKYHAPVSLIAAIFKCGEHSKYKSGETGNAKQDLQAEWPDINSQWQTSPADAKGPFQFTDATWKDYGVDCSGDGKADVQNLEDAACSASNMLKTNYDTATGTEEQKIKAAIYRYNQADWYVNRVYACYGALKTGQATTTTTVSYTWGPGGELIPPSTITTTTTIGTQQTLILKNGGVGLMHLDASEITNTGECGNDIKTANGGGGSNLSGYEKGFEEANIQCGVKILIAKLTTDQTRKSIIMQDPSYKVWSNCLNVQQASQVGQPTGARWPVNNKNIVSCYGDPRSQPHTAIDIGSSTGTNVYPILDGVVDATGSDVSGYGYFVRIKHSENLYSQYSHLSEIAVKTGTVTKDTIIAKTGGTPGTPGAGSSQGAHLDFKIWTSSDFSYDKAKNPLCLYSNDLISELRSNIANEATDEQGEPEACNAMFDKKDCAWIANTGISLAQTTASSNKLICVDPGHGDGSGAPNEETLNLQVSNKLKADLEEKGYSTYMTRTESGYVDSRITDCGPLRRILVNEQNCAALVSIHHDKANGAGPQIFVCDVNRQTRTITQPETCTNPQYTETNGQTYRVSENGDSALAAAIVKKLTAIGRTYKISPDTSSGVVNQGASSLGMVCRTTMPSVLIEIGNVDETGISDASIQDKIAQAIADGVVAYVG